MIVCPRCSRQLVDEAKFCDGCGEKITQSVTCSSCGKQMGEGFAFCQYCGAKTEAKQPAASVSAPVSNASPGNNFAIYAKKDGELYLNKFSGDPWRITERFGAFSNSDIFEAADQIAMCITVSKDGKTIFYPDRLLSLSNGMTLFYRGLNSEDDGVMIDTSVLKYSVNESATVVTYIKWGDGSLYQYSLNGDKKNKIDRDVQSFFVSDDGKKIVYYSHDNSIYFYNSESDSRKKIDSKSRVEVFSDDLTTLYYTNKNDDLYKKSEGGDKVKIASDVQRVYRGYDSGEVYYIKLSENDIVSVIDYIDDDMKESDALITKPVCSKKTTRDYYREHLKDRTMNHRIESFCCYNGTEEKVLNSALLVDRAYSSASAPVVVFSVYKLGRVPSIKLSEIKSLYDVSGMINAALFSEREYYIAVSDVVSALEEFDNISYYIRIDDSGEHLYYFNDEDGYGSTSDLYSAAIVDGRVQTSELYDTGITCMSYSSITFFNGKIAYWKSVNVDKHRGDLYVDKKKADDGIDYRTVMFDENSGAITYIADADSKGKGTLKIYRKGSVEEISDDVSDYCVLPNGNILYMYHYNIGRNSGKLYMYSSGVTEKVDDDVVAVFKITDEKYKDIDLFY